MICLYIHALVQIVLESFPISSSGHALLSSYLCPLPTLPAWVIKAWDYTLHFPTVCVVALYFRRRWFYPLLNINRCYYQVIKIFCYAALATAITLIGYIVKLFLPLPNIPPALGFFITLCSLFSLLLPRTGPYEKLTLKKLVYTSLLQVCALTPGVSRFALTFVGAIHMGIPARRAFEISFLVQWPLIFCASMYGIHTLWVSAPELLNPMVIRVMLGSSCLAYAGLSLQNYMVQKNLMWLWGVYMLVPFTVSILWGVFYG